MALGLIVTTRPIGEASAKKLTDSKLELTALRIDQAKDMIENEINQRKHSRISGDINDMVEDIISRAEGLPLALMEFAKLVSINPGMSIKTGQMPLALEPLIHSKFDKLSPSALSLAQYASALGNKVSETQLMQTVNLPDEDVKKGLAEIFEAKLLRKSNSGSLSFEHHLYQEICYNSMVRNRKREIHRKIYNEISVRAEKTGAHSVAYGSQILAYHAQKAGLLPEALDHLWQACTQAIATSAIRTAQSLYHRAVAICDQIGEDRQLRKLKFASLVFDALHQLAAHEEVLDVFEAARDRSFIGLKRTEEIVVRANIATILWISGKPDRAFPEAELALKLAEELDFIPVSAFANYAMANIEFVHGEIRKSVNRLTRISDIFVGDMAALRFGETITLPGVTCRTFASWYAVDLGELELAEKLENEAREIAVNQDHGYSKTLCDLAKGYKLYRTDKFKEASKFLTRAYSSCINESFFGLAPIAASWASSSLMGFGDDKQASEILEQELALDHIKSVRNCGLYYLHSAHAALLARRGQYDDAIDAHDKAFQATISNNDPVHQAYAHAGRAHLLATFGDAPEKAKEEYLLALELARNCEMARLVTACKTEIKSL
jgi:tetratricopeptide (TPR) repeat protein